MNNADFEKTQLWVNNLTNASAPLGAAPAAAPAAVKPLIPQKPNLKKLSKEEKVILASGGALAIGLGAIVLSSLPDPDQPAPAAPQTNPAHLAAPVLNLDTEPEVIEPVEPEPAKPAPRPVARREAPAHQAAPAAPSPEAPGQPQPLLQLPDTPEVATRVDDNQTFLEAFQTARAEVGPAGLFAWHNTFYSTFTDKEWESVPEDQKERWLEAAEPIIDPGYENLREIESQPESAEIHHNVIVAERGALFWTGIDKDGDGQVEILMGRINGQSPMVLLDTDGDGVLDTRYDFDTHKGKTYASQIEPFSMSSAEIEHMEYVPIEEGMGFFNDSERIKAKDSLPVSIFEKDGQYVIALDSNRDNTIDAITYLSDEKGPVVGLDFDNDGQIEMGYTYDLDTQSVVATEVDPLEEMTVDDPEVILFSSMEAPPYPDGYLEAVQKEDLAFEEEAPDGESTDSADDFGFGEADDYTYS